MLKTEKLVTFTLVLVLLASFAWAQYADTDDVTAVSSDYNVGYAAPYLLWGLDQVTWSALPSAPSVFGRAASGHIGRYVYHFGAEGNNIAQAYDLDTDTWVASTPCPLGYDNWFGVAANGEIYVGGRYDGAYHEDFWKFTPTAGGPTGTWTQLDSLPQAGCGIAAARSGVRFGSVISRNRAPHAPH